MNIPPEYTKHIFTAALVVFAALANSLFQWKVHRDDKRQFDGLDFIVITFLGGFVGTITGIVVQLWFGDGLHVTIAASLGAATGLAGFTAIHEIGLNMIIKGLGSFLKRLFNIK